jgi:hypothetical protein
MVSVSSLLRQTERSELKINNAIKSVVGTMPTMLL